MSKKWFHAYAVADVNISAVEDFRCNVNMIITDVRIRSPDIMVDLPETTTEMLQEMYFTENPDYSRVYIDFDIFCESEAKFRGILKYLQVKTNTFSNIFIQYETYNCF